MFMNLINLEPRVGICHNSPYFEKPLTYMASQMRLSVTRDVCSKASGQHYTNEHMLEKSGKYCQYTPYVEDCTIMNDTHF